VGFRDDQVGQQGTGRLGGHGRYVTFQMAEAAILKILFRKVLILIDDLR